MANAILVLNAGSSSIKFSAFTVEGSELKRFVYGQIESLFTAPRFEAKDVSATRIAEHEWLKGMQLSHQGALEHLIAFLHTYQSSYRLCAVGHRVAHGGLEYASPLRVDAPVLASLQKFVPLAPLHQPHNLAPIRILLERLPQLPQVACFDTAFHRAQPPLAQAFALPAELTEAGVRRYGFHGLSYEYITSVLANLDKRAAQGRTIVLHLGNGASMCAIKDGKSVATTMGFTALDGLPMGTRCGAIDPGVILYLMDERRMNARAIEKLLYQQSGLLGVSGISNDMRTLLNSVEPRAKLAVDLFVYRVGRELGSLAAALGGLDAMVFTGGIGEKSAVIRNRVCADAAWLGVDMDTKTNDIHGPRISSESSRVTAWVIPTNEELMIAQHTQAVITSNVSREIQSAGDKNPSAQYDQWRNLQRDLSAEGSSSSFSKGASENFPPHP